jgi:hypothetical protein
MTTMTAPRGTRLVMLMVGLALSLASFAVWFQWRQTRKCLAFYGSATAGYIQSAPRVELWELDGRADQPRRRRDITGARGLVHLRRGLVEDANFEWPSETGPTKPGPTEHAERAPNGAGWGAALAFFGSSDANEPATLLLLDFAASGDGGAGGSGRIAVAGRPAVAGLGRLRRGLERWIDDVAGTEVAGTANVSDAGDKPR